MEVKGKTVILKPISKHGKDRVHEQGSEWIIEQIRSEVSFDTKKGIWFGLRAVSGHRDGFRWVHTTKDKDFEIVFS